MDGPASGKTSPLTPALNPDQSLQDAPSESQGQMGHHRVSPVDTPATRIPEGTAPEDTGLHQRTVRPADQKKAPPATEKTLLCHDRDTLQQMIQQLLVKGSTLFTGKNSARDDHYRHYIAVNLQSALTSYKASDTPEEARNLADFLHHFAQKLRQEAQADSPPQELTALIDACDILGDLVEDRLNKTMVLECKARLKKAFGCYQNPSEESFLRVRGQLGLDLNVASMDGGYEISTQIVGCDDTKIRVFLNQKLSLRATAGNDALKGYVAGVMGKIDGKVFNNLDEFIDYYADNLLLSLHKPRYGRKISQAVYRIDQDNHQRQQLIARIPRLEKSLKTLKLAAVEQARLKYSDTGKDVPLSILRQVTEGHGGARIYRVAGIDRSAVKWGNTFTRRLPLLAQLEQHPQWLADYPSQYFNMTLPEGLATPWLKSLTRAYPADLDSTQPEAGTFIPLMGKRLAVLEDVVRRQGRVPDSLNQELTAARDSLTALIQTNYQEYKAYCRAVNNLRDHSGDSEDRALKSASEQRRQARKPAELLKMMLVTHARLKDMYYRTHQALEQARPEHTPWLEDIELDMTVPDIHVSQKDREQQLMLKKEAEGQIDFNDRIAKLALGPFEGLVDIRYIKNRHEPNPDSDGDYLYIALRGSLVGTASLTESSLEAALTKLMGTLPPVDGEAGIMIDPTAGADALLQGLKHLKLELFFVKGEDGHYHLQYKRRLSGEEVAAKAGGKVPVATMVTLTGQAAVDRYDYHFIGEDIGYNTMTYVMTRYNGWRTGDHPENWKAFTDEPKNRLNLARLMVNMATANTNASKELDSILTALRTEDANSPNGSATDKATEAWAHCFEALRQRHDQLKAQPELAEPVSTLDKLSAAVAKLKAELSRQPPSRQVMEPCLRQIEADLQNIELKKNTLKTRQDSLAADKVQALEAQASEVSQLAETIRSALQGYVLGRSKRTPVGVVRIRDKWQAAKGEALSASGVLDKFTAAMAKYETLSSEIGLNRTDEALFASLVRTPEFDQALTAFDQLLAANHPIYLQDAEGRFKAINPNQPPPYQPRRG